MVMAVMPVKNECVGDQSIKIYRRASTVREEFRLLVLLSTGVNRYKLISGWVRR